MVSKDGGFKSTNPNEGRITPRCYNVSGRCDGDGEKDDEKKREEDRYGPHSKSDESTGLLPGGSRLRGESWSWG
jgi:hypothetical protein